MAPAAPPLPGRPPSPGWPRLLRCGWLWFPGAHSVAAACLKMNLSSVLRLCSLCSPACGRPCRLPPHGLLPACCHPGHEKLKRRAPRRYPASGSRLMHGPLSSSPTSPQGHRWLDAVSLSVPAAVKWLSSPPSSPGGKTDGNTQEASGGSLA